MARYPRMWSSRIRMWTGMCRDSAESVSDSSSYLRLIFLPYFGDDNSTIVITLAWTPPSRLAVSLTTELLAKPTFPPSPLNAPPASPPPPSLTAPPVGVATFQTAKRRDHNHPFLPSPATSCARQRRRFPKQNASLTGSARLLSLSLSIPVPLSTRRRVRVRRVCPVVWPLLSRLSRV